MQIIKKEKTVWTDPMLKLSSVISLSGQMCHLTDLPLYFDPHFIEIYSCQLEEA
jgi:hypothetical protein